MLWYGYLSVCVSVCPALSAHWDVRGPDLITVSLCLPLHLILPFCSWDHQYKHTHTPTPTHPNKADERKCSKTVQYIRQWRSLKGQDSCQCVVTCPDSWYRQNSGVYGRRRGMIPTIDLWSLWGESLLWSPVLLYMLVLCCKCECHITFTECILHVVRRSVNMTGY